MRWLVALLGLAGCDQLWNLQHVDQEPREAGAIDADLSGCPMTYGLPVDGYPSRYRYEATGTSWDGAETLCAAETTGLTHLVVLQDDDERLAIVTALAKVGSTSSVWIGLSDRVMEGEYRWVTDERVGMPPLENPPWPAGQPDNSGTGGTEQDCVRIQGMTGAAPTLFDDGECSSIFDYVCECDGNPPAPENF